MRVVVEASPVLACETCPQLRDWGSANGPDGLVQRIAVMIDLAADGSFEELRPRYIDGYYRDCVPWSSAQPGEPANSRSGRFWSRSRSA